MLKLAMISALLSLTIAYPMIDLDHEDNADHGLVYIRIPRSPHTFNVTGQMVPGGAGAVRADLGVPMWTSSDGAHSVQGGAFYQRNFNTPGRRENWGADVGYTWKF